MIELSWAEQASSVVFALAKDSTFCFCVDCRRLNAMNVRDTYPIPRNDECIESVDDAVVFTTVNANHGYWQCEVEEIDRDKATFTSNMGLYRYVRMPFGLMNAPDTLQIALNIILSRVEWKFALVYLDDVIIYSRSVREHFGHLESVLKLLRLAGITLSLEQCFYFHKAVDLLGQVIHLGKVQVSGEACESL